MVLLLRDSEKTEILASLKAVENSFAAFHYNFCQSLREIDSRIATLTNTTSIPPLSFPPQPTDPINPTFDELLKKLETAWYVAEGSTPDIGRIAPAEIVSATEHDCLVVNAPIANIVAATDHVEALPTAMLRNIAQVDASIKAVKWPRTKYVDKILTNITTSQDNFEEYDSTYVVCSILVAFARCLDSPVFVLPRFLNIVLAGPIFRAFYERAVILWTEEPPGIQELSGNVLFDLNFTSLDGCNWLIQIGSTRSLSFDSICGDKHLYHIVPLVKFHGFVPYFYTGLGICWSSICANVDFPLKVIYPCCILLNLMLYPISISWGCSWVWIGMGFIDGANVIPRVVSASACAATRTKVLLSAFECPHRGKRNNYVQFAGEVQPKGCHYLLDILSDDQKMFNRQVVKSETATSKIPELALEIPPEAQYGSLSTIEGILVRAADEWRKIDYHTTAVIDEFLMKLRVCDSGESHFTFILDDLSGNNFLGNLYVPSSDPPLTIKSYERTPEQQAALGYIAEQSLGESSLESSSDGTTNVSLRQDEPQGSVGAGAGCRAIAPGNSAEIADALFRYSAPEEVMCFVNCHFTGHLEVVNHRNADVDHVYRAMTFGRPSSSVYALASNVSSMVQVFRTTNTMNVHPVEVLLELFEADMVAYLGDFNFRLEVGCELISCFVAITINLALKLGEGKTIPKGSSSYLVIVVCTLVLTYGRSWDSFGWLVSSELFPLETPSSGQNMVVCINMIFTALIAQCFQVSLCHLKHGIFFLLAGLTFIMTGFIFFLLPETKQVLEEKHLLWQTPQVGRDLHKLSNRSYGAFEITTRIELVAYHLNLPEYANWGNCSSRRKDYPNFHLEDKVVLKGLGNDTPARIKQMEPKKDEAQTYDTAHKKIYDPAHPAQTEDITHKKNQDIFQTEDSIQSEKNQYHTILAATKKRQQG